MARAKEEIQAEIKDLERIAAKRRGKPGYGENVGVIEARLSELRTELEGADE